MGEAHAGTDVRMGGQAMVMMLALGAALTYGAADFLGGAASRRANVLKVLLITVPVGLLMLVLAAVAMGVPGGGVTRAGMVWGFLSGVAGGTGLIAFYRALAQGPMSVVAPVSALAAAVIPVAVGLMHGERLDALVIAGVLLCLVAVGLVSMDAAAESEPGEPGPSGMIGTAGAVGAIGATDTNGGEESRPAGRDWKRIFMSGPVVAAFSGIGFGVFFVLLKEAGSESGLWPLVASRTAGVSVVVVALLLNGRRGEPITRGSTLTLAVLSGLLDAAANALYYLAVHSGLLSLAAVLTSLYPAVTVLLARAIYSERLRPVQQAGLAVALAGVALVTVG